MTKEDYMSVALEEAKRVWDLQIPIQWWERS